MATPDISSLLNRPLLADDLATGLDPIQKDMVRLVHEYQTLHLPAMNGSFQYSNLMEGSQHALTCLPYRLWEYGSLFLVLDAATEHKRFVDIGGAASPLVYFLAERGYAGVTVDMQPLLVDLTNHVAAVRRLPLQGRLGDVTALDSTWHNEFDFATCISVLEHIPEPARLDALTAMQRMLKPGGFLYLTFDYGDYQTVHTQYHRGERAMDAPVETVTSSIKDLERLVADFSAAGFHQLGNDILELPPAIRGLTVSPHAAKVQHERALTIGPIDGKTPWKRLLKYVVRRLTGFPMARLGRFGRHNFFRVFLKK